MSNGDIRNKIALLINCAGIARRSAADYLAKKRPADVERKIADARWYVRLAHDRNADRTAS